MKAKKKELIIKKMKKRIKTKWLSALRSDEYQQCQEQLRVDSETDRSFCCLGVLCDIYSKEKKIKWKLLGGMQKIHEEGYLLPKKVREWAGIEDDQVTVGKGLNLVTLNDDGKTFKQIARYIEKYL